MSYIIKFFRYVADGIIKIFGWVVSLPGQIVTLFTTIGSSVWTAIEFFSGHSSTVDQLCGKVDQAAASVQMSSGVMSDTFQAFGYTLALDVAWEMIVGLVAFFIAILSLLIIVIVPFIITFGFSVTVINTTRNMVNAFLPNAAKF